MAYFAYFACFVAGTLFGIFGVIGGVVIMMVRQEAKLDLTRNRAG